METTELLRPAFAASENAADVIGQNLEADTANESAMNKAEIIAELEKMVASRLFSGHPWLPDKEIISAYDRKLRQMGLIEQVRTEPPTWQCTPLGKELGVKLFEVFMGLWSEWEVPFILKEYDLLNESELRVILTCMTEANAERLLSGYVKGAYFDYRETTTTPVTSEEILLSIARSLRASAEELRRSRPRSPREDGDGLVSLMPLARSSR
jgi:hypothetical protein